MSGTELSLSEAAKFVDEHRQELNYRIGMYSWMRNIYGMKEDEIVTRVFLETVAIERLSEELKKNKDSERINFLTNFWKEIDRSEPMGRIRERGLY